jgi:beta-glucanase (GH16 family)
LLTAVDLEKQMPRRIDPDCWTLSFADEFDRLDLWDGAGGTWKTSYVWGNDQPINGELQSYVDPRLHPVNPFTVENGVLSIIADVAGEAVRDATGGRSFTSGLLTTEKSFAQTYGYFEVQAQVPAGKGLWPAFWMLPAHDRWPEGVVTLPEIDVLEVLGDDPETYYVHVHTNESGDSTATGFAHREKVDLSAAFHRYGVAWNARDIVWYLDGKEVASAPTPTDLHTPMYVLINLAVGGKWPGAPDETTVFPAPYRVDHVRIYREAQPLPAKCGEKYGSPGAGVIAEVVHLAPDPALVGLALGIDGGS